MMAVTPLITLTTDFGDGPFVGLMKLVILSICPKAGLVDLSHKVPPQNIRAGALVLEQALDVSPKGTVHLAVVDPGVGAGRRCICIDTLGMRFVGPDNGIFTPVLLASPEARCHEITAGGFMRDKIAPTFHGRDIFAPAAGHLARGVSVAEMGPTLDDPVMLEWPLPMREKDILHGVVLTADRFGNITTNINRRDLEKFLGGADPQIRIAGLNIKGMLDTYAQAGPGAYLALYDSLDRLEIARNQGDAAASLGLSPEEIFGLAVRVSRLD